MKDKLVGKVIHILELLTYILIGISIIIIILIIILRDKHIENIASLIGFAILFCRIIDMIREFSSKRVLEQHI